MRTHRIIALFRLHLLLIALLFALYAADISGLTLTQTVREAPLALLPMAAVDASVLAWLVHRFRSDRWRSLLAIFAPALIIVWRNPTAHDAPDRAHRPWYGWLWRLALAGLLWAVIFVAGGLLVFQPLATVLNRAAAEAYLSAFTPDAPGTVLLFQAGRGALWALLTTPVLSLLQGPRRRSGLALALVYAGLMGSNLLLPNDVLPGSVRLAHLAEVIVENFLFGFIVVRLLWLPAVREVRAGRLGLRIMDMGKV